MNVRNQENLKELLETFFNAEDAQRCAKDFIRAEQILKDNPAPEPKKELIEAINLKIAQTLELRQEHVFRRFAYRLAPVAAMFVVLAAVGIKILKPGAEPNAPTYGPIISAAVWNSDNVAAEDRNLVILTTELDELEMEVMTLERTDNGDFIRNSTITELEMDFAEISDNIWEG